MATHHDYYVYVLFRRKPRVEPFYVGMGRGDRWQRHTSEARRIGKRHIYNIYKDRIIKAMLDAHLDVPKIKISEGLTQLEAISIETELIHAIGRKPNGPLVNLMDGPYDIAHKIMSAELLREKIIFQFPLERAINLRVSGKSSKDVASLLGYSRRKFEYWINKLASKEQLALLKSTESQLKGRATGLRLRGKRISATHRARISASKIGRSRPEIQGIPRSFETRRKISETKRNKKFRSQLSFDF